MPNDPSPRDPYGLSDLWRETTGYGYHTSTAQENDATRDLADNPKFVEKLRQAALQGKTP